MHHLLFDHDKTVAEWVYRKAGVNPSSDPYSAFGVVDDEGTLRGGFVFTGVNSGSVVLSMAGNGAATRSAFCALLNYVFVQLGCARIEMNTRRSNKRVRKMLSKLFFFEGISRRFYGDEDGLRFSLTIDDLSAFKKRWRLP